MLNAQRKGMSETQGIQSKLVQKQDKYALDNLDELQLYILTNPTQAEQQKVVPFINKKQIYTLKKLFRFMNQNIQGDNTREQQQLQQPLNANSSQPQWNFNHPIQTQFGNYNFQQNTANGGIPDRSNFNPGMQMASFANGQRNMTMPQIQGGSINFNLFNYRPPVPPPPPPPQPQQNQGRFNPNQKKPYGQPNQQNYRPPYHQKFDNNQPFQQQMNYANGGYQNEWNNYANKNKNEQNNSFGNRKKQSQNRQQKGAGEKKPPQNQGGDPRSQKNNQQQQVQQQHHQQQQPIKKRTDVFLEDHEEIKKWVEQRKRNYPSADSIARKQQEEKDNYEHGQANMNELSRLEMKLRKKIMISNGNLKKLEIRQKHFDMLRRLYTEGDKAPKIMKTQQTRVVTAAAESKRESKRRKREERVTQNTEISPVIATPIAKVIYSEQEIKQKKNLMKSLLNKLVKKRQLYLQIKEKLDSQHKIYEQVQQNINEKGDDNDSPIEVPLVSLRKSDADDTHLVQQQSYQKQEDLIKQSDTEQEEVKTKAQPVIKKHIQKDFKKNNGYAQDQNLRHHHGNKSDRYQKEEVFDNCTSEDICGNDSEKLKEMITELKEKRDKYSEELDHVFNYKANSSNFRYRTDTLLTNLVLDEIYKERNYLLQAIRYIVSNNFFDEKESEQLQQVKEHQEVYEKDEKANKS